jgi:hypothetical protein
MREKMLSKLSLAFVVAAFSIVPAKADQFMTTKELVAYCNDLDSDLRFGSCIGYLQGVADLLGTVRASRNVSDCVPVGVTAGTLKNIFLNFAALNPQYENYSASVPAIASFAKAFCEDKK